MPVSYNDFNIPDAPYIREAEACGMDYVYEFLGLLSDAEDHPGFFDEDYENEL